MPSYLFSEVLRILWWVEPKITKFYLIFP